MSTILDVIIPTFRDWNRLQLCLDALQNQSLEQSLFTVVIVNNCPDDPPPDWLTLSENARIETQDIKGSYAARNLGVSVSSSPIIAFTDSDCIPERTWLESGISRLQDCDRLAGKISLFSKNLYPNSADIYEFGFSFPQDFYVKRGVSVTANLFVRRSHFLAIGYFSEQLHSGGDFEWSARATASGSKLSYAEDAVVLHPTAGSMEVLLAKRRRVFGKGSKNFLSLRTVLKLLTPPVPRISRLARLEQLTTSQKILAFLICYFLNLYSLAVLTRLIGEKVRA